MHTASEMENEENKPFLAPESHSSEPNISHGRPMKPGLVRTSTLIHLVLISLYTIVSLMVIKMNGCPSLVLLQNAGPLRDVSIKYKSTIFRNLEGSPFAGPPSAEVDSAWDSLLAPVNIRVSQEELERAAQNSVALPESGGYLAWLQSFHEIHCIKMLRQWNYRTYYHPDITKEEEKHLASHADHCFEMLRQAAVCHADVSLTTFVWNETKEKPMFDASEKRHTCVDWEELMASTAGRVVSDEEMARLKNPMMNATI